MSLLGHNQTTTINRLAVDRLTVQNAFNLSSIYHCIFIVIIIRLSRVFQPDKSPPPEEAFPTILKNTHTELRLTRKR